MYASLYQSQCIIINYNSAEQKQNSDTYNFKNSFNFIFYHFNLILDKLESLVSTHDWQQSRKSF